MFKIYYKHANHWSSKTTISILGFLHTKNTESYSYCNIDLES